MINKKWLLAVMVMLIGVASVRFVGQSDTKNYYSGDGLEYAGNLYVATANSGSAEIFRLDGGQLNLLARFKPVKEAGMITDGVSDVILAEEADGLMLYLASGNRLYKYDINQPNLPKLLFKNTDNTWDWYGRLAKSAGQLVTVGSKGVKIWNSDLRVIDSYDVINTSNPYNVRLSSDGHIFNVADGKLTVYSRDYRKMIKEIPLSINEVKGNKRVAFDEAASMFYVIDDAAFKRVGLAGEIYKSLRHDSRYGYDAVLSDDRSVVYLSNGNSVAKLDKMTFRFVAGYENNQRTWAGAWAMGLDLVEGKLSDKLVVFNNSGIAVLDENLRLVGAYRVEAETLNAERQAKEVVKDQLSIALDKATVAVYGDVAVSGRGFWPKETIDVSIAGKTFEVIADADGRFTKVLAVPATKQSKTDVKASGRDSGLTYSSSLNILQLQ